MTPLAELARDVGPVLDEVAAAYGTVPSVGGSFLLARVARAVAEPCLRSLLDERMTPVLSPDAVTVGLNREGRVERVSFGAAREPADPRSFAAGLVAAFDGVVEALHATIPVGRRGLWGLVSDAVGGAGVAIHATSGSAALERCEEILDELAARHGSTARPTWSLADDVIELRRGSCCLAFHLDGHGYCETCPVGRRPPPR